jgi:predicted amidophosphoribosyltransferase
VPVPSYRGKSDQGGQATSIADIVGYELDLAVEDILVKTSESKAVGMKAAERVEMIDNGTFALAEKSTTTKGKKVLLVDDTITTGSTASGCANVLRGSGAAEVSLLVAGKTWS